jgi:1,4-dihydroxy-2-naphthoyl-CoA hydrolase
MNDGRSHRTDDSADDSRDSSGDSSGDGDRLLAGFIAGEDDAMGALNAKMGVRILEASAERVVATMPVEGNTQPYGLLHGGASVVLAESLGSLGSAIHAHPDRVSVGVDINATHHRAVTSGLVTGVATPLHLGRSTASYQVVITDDQERRVCTCRITCALIPRDRG